MNRKLLLAILESQFSLVYETLLALTPRVADLFGEEIADAMRENVERAKACLAAGASEQALDFVVDAFRPLTSSGEPCRCGR